MNDQTELLRVEWNSLRGQWDAAKDYWNDQAMVMFERDCWEECGRVTNSLLEAMDVLDAESGKALLTIDE